MSVEVSEEVRGMIMQFQAYQQQSQMITGQKDATKAQIIEIDRTLEELEKAGDREIYKSVGPILIKTTGEEMKKELSEKKEMLGLRLKTMDSEDKKTREKIKDLQEKIQGSLSKKQA
ncbi:MAG: prefoldin subunit beta [Candidatus Aenigmarchaeota archaeon]|nr:prefoldin subunit beta [Candidatus Aenigmarchaeota archaeon]